MDVLPWEYELRHALSSFNGILLLWLVAALFVWAMFSQKGRWAALTLTLYFTTFAVDFIHRDSAQIIAPLNQLRQLCEPIIFAMFVVVTCTNLYGRQVTWHRPMLAGILALFVFQLVVDARAGMAYGTFRAVLGAVAHLLMLFGLVIGLSFQIKSFEDADSVIWCIAFAAALFVIGTTTQLVINPAPIVFGSRLEGTTNNPQAAALFIAGVLPAVCYLLIRPGQKVIWRIFIGGLIAFLLIFIVWTGSRTGVIVASVSLLMMFRLRMGKLLASVMLCGILVIIAMTLFSNGPQEAVAHLTDTNNSRAQVWSQSFEEFQSHPWLGSGINDRAFHESSYLSALATVGIVGSIPLAAAMFLIALALVRLQRIRRELMENAFLADLVMAGLVSAGVAGIFEAIFFGTFASPIVLIMIYLTLLRFLLDPAIRQPDQNFHWIDGNGMDWYEDENASLMPNQY